MSRTRKVLITGVCGGVGRVLLRKLLEHSRYRILGLDRRNWVLDRPERFDFRQLDLRRSGTEDLIRVERPWGVVHLAFVSDQRVDRARRHEVNVVGTQRLLGWCTKYGVKRVVILSRASVYGARPDNPSLITEDQPLRLGAVYTQLDDLVEFDHLCRSWMWEHREMGMSLLRPVHIVGPNIREGMLYQYLKRNPIPTALGFDPMVQVVHEEDAIQSILCALKGKRSGIYNVAGPGALPLSILLRELGRKTLPIPHPFFALGNWAAFGLGLSKLPSQAIDFVRYSCLVDGSLIRDDLGYEPSYDLPATLAAIPRFHGPIID